MTVFNCIDGHISHFCFVSPRLKILFDPTFEYGWSPDHERREKKFRVHPLLEGVSEAKCIKAWFVLEWQCTIQWSTPSYCSWLHLGWRWSSLLNVLCQQVIGPHSTSNKADLLNKDDNCIQHSFLVRMDLFIFVTCKITSNTWFHNVHAPTNISPHVSPQLLLLK